MACLGFELGPQDERRRQSMEGAGDFTELW